MSTGTTSFSCGFVGEDEDPPPLPGFGPWGSRSLAEIIATVRRRRLFRRGVTFWRRATAAAPRRPRIRMVRPRIRRRTTAASSTAGSGPGGDDGADEPRPTDPAVALRCHGVERPREVREEQQSIRIARRLDELERKAARAEAMAGDALDLAGEVLRGVRS